ncbi:type I-E CRISPR-associated protein Cas5/CasD [Allokutzneria albata]|uniref:CRISPR-associated protein, Cas5e family n=1 Tax=Allokutzneria albata TaxID=211114 RepID=A0A1G9WEP5_ALLAB|nr:type I-E CRISPR-associated protein Cas5/CasD [Allokutzneria albata]SDM82733.1 CRISPR-associated protein, Cas5e family [Allokutzneria albata]
MTVLLLRLGAPLQSWGTSSRFVRRNTDRAPSRSGIIGLLAAAQGRGRTDPLDDLLQVSIGVRIDQPGTLERDFQTARTRDGAHSMPLSYRFYLADAVFAVAIGAEPAFLDTLLAALRRPHFPLYLGRRSCPPAGKLLHGMRDGDPATVLTTEPWMASPWVRRTHHAATVDLDVVLDCAPDEPTAELVRDEPISFDPRHRRYGWRTITRRTVSVPNPAYHGVDDADELDPMAVFEEMA